MEDQNSKLGQDTFAPWDQVSLSPPDRWVEELTYERNIPAKSRDHITNLLWERQVEVEKGISFHRTAVRLETGLAVQHQSQWRLDLDLRNQHLSLHWLRVIRGGNTSDQLQRERLRLMHDMAAQFETKRDGELFRVQIVVPL